MDLLKDLSPPQREAVTHPGGPLLVLAGAGSGKTRVLTYRIAHLIGTLEVKPHNVLAVTFTNKAAEEMRSRVVSLVGGLPEGLWLGTFHSVCVRILRENAKLLEYPRNFTIYDGTDQLNLTKRVMKELDISERAFDPRGVRARMSRAKNALTPPDEYLQSDLAEEIVARVYARYQEKARQNGALDFDDLLMKAVELFWEKPAVLGKYSRRFRHILVDEYQDTNHAQYVMVELLSRTHRNLCVVGDDDQSIYGFRGADISNILDFERDFPDAKVVRLEQNYRSTQRILSAAHSVVSRNLGRKEKELWTRNKPGEEIEFFEAKDEKEEASLVVAAIRDELSAQARSLRDFVVLYRTNAQSRPLEEALRAWDLPYLMVGGVRFYERKEVKDILAYLKVIANPLDSLSLARIVNTPRRGIGEKTVEKLTDLAQSRSSSLYEMIGRNREMEGLSSRVRSALSGFFQLVEGYRTLKDSLPVSRLAGEVLEEIGYLRELSEEDTVEAEGRIENVKELLISIEDFSESSADPSLDNYLAKISLFTDIDGWDNRQEAITLMTAHNAKGLEFPVVFVCGLEDGLFPHSSSFHSPEELEEERRLFYVALTRAKEKVYLSYAKERQRSGKRLCQPCRFLEEIPKELFKTSPGRRAPSLGARVYHRLWGFAKVTDLEGEGEKQKATLLLENGEEKRVMVKYAKLEIIGQ